MNAVVTLTDAKVLLGQRAWKKIKATAAEQRELWRQVGEALLVGRTLYPGKKNDRAFGQWCKDNEFGDMGRRYRSAAMWLAANWVACGSITPTLSDPIELQKQYDKQQKLKGIPQDAPTFTKVDSVDIAKPDARKASKLLSRSKSGDEGAATAQRHLDALCKSKGVTQEALEDAVSNTVPEDYYCIPPTYLQFAQDIREGMLDHFNQILAQVTNSTITEEALASICISVFTELKQQLKAKQ